MDYGDFMASLIIPPNRCGSLHQIDEVNFSNYKYISFNNYLDINIYVKDIYFIFINLI